MLKEKNTVWRSEQAQQFAEVLTGIADKNLMQDFLRDVMTKKEIIEISSRLEAAKMLKNGYKYTDITAKTKLSSRTVARISEWMKNGCKGYAVILNQINNHDHIPPVRAV